MDSASNDRPVTDPDDARRAVESAQERYTAARRKYTALYVDFKSSNHPDRNLAAALDAARSEALSLATALRLVEDGDAEAIRQELAADPVSDEERARTTNRFTIAELHRAAAASAPASWDWKD
jgi:hypothetical protein